MNIAFLGNKELLGVQKTAFLAASNIPPGMIPIEEGYSPKFYGAISWVNWDYAFSHITMCL